MANFKVGDVVVLKSGGPNMTVRLVQDGSRISCSWFAGKKHETAQFPEDALDSAPVEPAKSGET